MREDAGCTRAAIARARGRGSVPDHEARGPGHRPDARDVCAGRGGPRGRPHGAGVPRHRAERSAIATRSAMAECLLGVAPPALAGDARGGRPAPGPRLGRCRPSRPGGSARGGHGDRVATSAGSSSCSGGARRRPRRCRPRLLALVVSDGRPAISRLLVVRWTRTNREVARDARQAAGEPPTRQTREMRSTRSRERRAWPGPALLWVRRGIDRGRLGAVAAVSDDRGDAGRRLGRDVRRSRAPRPARPRTDPGWPR